MGLAGGLATNGGLLAIGGLTPSFPLATSVDQTFQPTGVTSNALTLHNNASAVNGLEITGTATGVAPVISAVGNDTNIGIVLTPKGTGTISSSANVIAPILDNGGAVVNVLAAGAVGNGIADDTAAINGALASGRTLYFPIGFTFLVSQILATSLTNIAFTGGGTIVGSDRTQDVLKAIGCTGIKVSDLHIEHQTPGARTAFGMVVLHTCTNYDIGGVEAFNSSGLGVYVQASSYGTVHGCYVHDTGADGIAHTTLTGGAACSHFVVTGNTAFNTGDDAYSVTAYQAVGTQCSDFSIVGNVSMNSKARGIAIAGGLNGTVSGNTVNAPTDSGIIVSQSSATLTLGSTNINIVGNTVANANSYNTPASTEASIQITANQAAYPLDGILVAGNRIATSAHNFILAQGSLAGTITTLAIKSNVCEGPMLGGANDSGIFCIYVDRVTVSDNDVEYAAGHGINIQGTCAVGIVTNNKIWHPNQGNTGAIYGVQNNAATAGTNWGNLVAPDAGVTALLANELCANPVYSVAFSLGPVLTSIVSTGSLPILPNNVANNALLINNQGSAVNGIQITGTATGSAPIIAAVGGDTNIPIQLTTKGTSNLKITAGGLFINNGLYSSTSVMQFQPSAIVTTALNITNNTSAVNGLKVSGTATTVAPILSGLGSDSNIGISITPKGTGTTTITAGGLSVTGVITIATGTKTTVITSGALSTQQFVSTTGAPVLTTRDVFLYTPVTYNPTAGATATCVVAISPDNVTYTTLSTETMPVGVTFDGTIRSTSLWLPAGWYAKFTTVNSTLGLSTYW